MKVLMLSIDTRGDCEPFLEVAEMLRELGEDVICAFPEQFRILSEDSGFRFRSLGRGFIDLIGSKDGRDAFSGKGLRRIAATFAVAKASAPIQKDMIRTQRDIIENEKPDVVIFHPKAVYPVSHHLSTGNRVILLGTVPQMLHEVKGKAHIGLDGLPPPLSYQIANRTASRQAIRSVKPSCSY
jgi:UDP:flavonoid glycosyltransferase YjiC (YdhE family)